jgi:DNA primase
MDTNKFSWEAVKQQDMVEYLTNLGQVPVRINRNDYWYLSPFRKEKEASFKIDRQQNCWYDFGEGVGGNPVDFLLKLYNCSIKELYHKLNSGQTDKFSISVPIIKRDSILNSNSKIKIKQALSITHPALINYLESRCIPLDIARQFCQEIHYIVHNKNYFAIGFKNDLGGYELRNQHFKGSSSPKSVTFIDNKSGKLLVFEGFFSFLSWLTIQKNSNTQLTNYLVLNSLSFFRNQRLLMQQHDSIDLYLDRDEAGIKARNIALEWSSNFTNCSILYNGYKDLNEWLQQKSKSSRQS